MGENINACRILVENLERIRHHGEPEVDGKLY
jgi:hypothetical protein